MFPKEITSKWCVWPGWSDGGLWQSIETLIVLIASFGLGLALLVVLYPGSVVAISHSKNYRTRRLTISRRVYKLPLGVKVKRLLVSWGKAALFACWAIALSGLRTAWRKAND